TSRHACLYNAFPHMNQNKFFFFFSSRRRHTRYWRDWSSDVCSSDLPDEGGTDEIVSTLEARIDRLDALRGRLTSTVTAFVLVLTPERLPIDETARAAARLQEAALTVGAIVV